MSKDNDYEEKLVDALACFAMQGILANSRTYITPNPEKTAELSYQYATAMICEREKIKNG